MFDYLGHRICTRDLDVPIDSCRRKDAYKKTEDWRGPHERRIVNLLKMGYKPAAMLDNMSSEYRHLKLYIDQKLLVSTKLERLSYKDNRHVMSANFVVTTEKESWRAERLQEIYRKIDLRNQEKFSTMLYNEHQEVGELLGYSDREIKMFVNYLKEKT